MEDRLSGCPLCNGDVDVDHIDSDVWIDCCMCHAHFRVMASGFPANWNTRATDPLMEEMAKALERIDQWDWNVILQYSECDKEVFDDLKNVEQALQKYRERKDAK